MKIKGFKLNELQDAWIAICTCIANIWFNWIFCKMRELQYEHKVHEFWFKIEWRNIVSLHNQKVRTGRVSRNTDERQRVGTNNTSKQSGQKIELTKVKWITNQGVGSRNREGETETREWHKQHKQVEKRDSRPLLMQETEHHTGLSYRVITSNLSAQRVCIQSTAIARFNHTVLPHRVREWEHSMRRCRHKKEFW